MDPNRRQQVRRRTDRALQETIDILRVLEKISRGEGGDFGEQYADLVALKDRLGRREEDRKLGESLCSAIEGIATNIGSLLEKDKPLRKVRVIKMSGRKNAQVEIQSAVVGWEESRPLVGKNYRIFKDDGGVFRSAVVVKVVPGFFQTQNSLYRVEVVQED